MKKLKVFSVLFLTYVLILVLPSCSTPKAGAQGNAQTEAAVSKLSATIAVIDPKVEQFVIGVFTGELTIEGITKQHLNELKDPLKGFAAAMFNEWQSYSLKNANKDNQKYVSYKLALPKAKGPLSKKIADAINGQLSTVFDQQRKLYKECRSGRSSGDCVAQFNEKTQKQLSDIIDKVIRAYYLERLNKL